MAVTDAIANIAHQFRVCARRPSGFSMDVAATYTRLQWQEIRRHRGASAAVRQWIAGAEIFAPNLGALIGLYKEIFIAEEYYFKASTSAPVIIDAGANIGLASLYFRRLYPGAIITAFEPDPQTFGALSRNTSGLGVECIDAAIDAQDKEADLYTADAYGVSGSLYTSVRLPGSVKVRCVRLSDYIDRSVDLLKLDVEGAETGVLRELSETGKLLHVRRIIMEYHPHKGQPVNDLATCLRLLADFGPEVHGGIVRGAR